MTTITFCKTNEIITEYRAVAIDEYVRKIGDRILFSTAQNWGHNTVFHG